ncbi:hypothetical protein T310_1250 [Rasamsonia emersonii CBS 393.64]|uniref:Major facilitator superfamily (MFS) profile domain-containing protein n=1 Tax=Rasamsonia emersonii (strain ATCC 16479 / CBS 393.64 / IMI 116815) TaxID=1408163 RepID=A0A0F4Z3P9_RASE3|nr:hypothetical protein T310_1250 [Rasamsonia emersonii CBS 393.64]KKA24701.1 hypothetical protein T310_1250 [Rasamsonia emersonii CBS 393.64]
MLRMWRRSSTSDYETEKLRKTPPSRSIPRGLKWRSSRPFIVGVISFAIFTIVPVAPTALEERVGLPAKDRQRWTSILLSLYGACLLAASHIRLITKSAIFGYLADKMDSRKWPLIFGLVALAASTSLLCVGTTLALWITGRIFQGISAAMVWTVGMALLVDTFGDHEVGSAMGFVGMSFSTGIMLGPLLGGIIYQNAGYYAVFAVTFAMIGVDIVLRVVMIEAKDARKWLGESASESTTSDVSLDRTHDVLLSDLAKETLAPHSQRTCHPRILVSPLPPKRRLPSSFILLKSPRMLLALYAYFVISILMDSFDSVLPIFVQDTFGWGQTGQGLVFIALCLPHFLEPIWGRFGDRHQHAWRLLAAGAFFLNVPLLVLLRLVSANTIGLKVLLCVLLAFIGVSFSMATPAVMTEVSLVMNDIKAKSPDAFGKNGAVAQAYGLMNCAFALGELIGPVWAGFIREDHGWGTMSWTLGLLSGVTAIPVSLGLGGWIGNLRKVKREGPDTGDQSSV